MPSRDAIENKFAKGRNENRYAVFKATTFPHCHCSALDHLELEPLISHENGQPIAEMPATLAELANLSGELLFICSPLHSPSLSLSLSLSED